MGESECELCSDQLTTKGQYKKYDSKIWKVCQRCLKTMNFKEKQKIWLINVF